MRPKYLIIFTFVVIIMIGFSQVIVSEDDSSDATPTKMPTSPTPTAQNKAVEVVVESSATSSAMIEPTATRVVLTDDGPTLLHNQCSKCHSIHLIQLTKKDRVEWEKALSMMERMGASLTEAERTVLIDYLAVPDD